MQVVQVVLAPIPGEATGFAGGLLFGTGPGFLYSTIGLTLGSWINLLLGRLLGRGFVRRVVSQAHLSRFDALMQGQGLLAALALFVLPGFPKDYLCLFLGLSQLPLRVLLTVAAAGRMPGTFLLSLQGANLARGMFLSFAIVAAICGAGLWLAYRHRAKWQCWITGLRAVEPLPEEETIGAKGKVSPEAGKTPKE